MDLVSESRTFGGRQQVWRHESQAVSGPMRFALYLPPAAERGPVPTLLWLSGLTCTEENFSIKAGAQRIASELGLGLIIPDTSPRGEHVANDPAIDLGQGAGFYVDATEPPWAPHFRMHSYVTGDLLDAAFEGRPLDRNRLGISGHSMGGHGAMVTALKRPELFRSVSAFAPISSPMNCPWGRKAFTAYLGPDEARWRAWDAPALIEDGARLPELLVDQGEADPYLAEQLKPQLLEAACAKAGQPLDLRRRADYDHSYFYVGTFLEEHFRWHLARLGG